MQIFSLPSFFVFLVVFLSVFLFFRAEQHLGDQHVQKVWVLRLPNRHRVLFWGGGRLRHAQGIGTFF